MGGLNAATGVVLGVIMLILAPVLAIPGTMGTGDIKLMLVVVLGLQGNALHALVLALVLAWLIAAAAVISRGHEARRKSQPLAPFLAPGSLLAVL